MPIGLINPSCFSDRLSLPHPNTSVKNGPQDRYRRRRLDHWRKQPSPPSSSFQSSRSQDATELTLSIQAGGGIGQQAAFSFAQAGASGIVFADIDEARSAEAVESTLKFASNPNYRGVFFKVDVTNEEPVQGMVDFAVKEFGRIDYAVNGAGVRGPPLHF